MTRSKQDKRTNMSAEILKKYGLKIGTEDEILTLYGLLKSELSHVKNLLALLCVLVFVLFAFILYTQLQNL